MKAAEVTRNLDLKDSMNGKTSVHVLDPSMVVIQHMTDSGEHATQKLKIHNLFQYVGNIF